MWHTVTVRDGLRAECPGSGQYAALNGHTVRFIGRGARERDPFRPTRQPDTWPRTIDASWHGGGLLADCGYASLERLRACGPPEVRLVIRLQDHWSPKVDLMARGQGTPKFFPGTEFDGLLEEDILVSLPRWGAHV